MLSGIHILLTYECNFECDHCFLHCGPFVRGTFTLERLSALFAEIDKINSIEWVYFEGGEPFLYYPLMLEGIRMAKERGLKAGIVSNAYWATSPADAQLWLKPLAHLGIDDLSLSSDDFHESEESEHSPQWAAEAARKLDLAADTICIEGPTVLHKSATPDQKGEPIVSGGVRFRGRAAEKLVDGLPTRPAEELTCCPDEDLETPSRVHIDSYGNVHICQGLLMGNLERGPLIDLLRNYRAQEHPICGSLLRGGPAQLARDYDIRLQDQFVDECHFCYLARKSLIDHFPELLGPKLVYGLEK